MEAGVTVLSTGRVTICHSRHFRELINQQAIYIRMVSWISSIVSLNTALERYTTQIESIDIKLHQDHSEKIVIKHHQDTARRLF
jgi:hypothetical protein